MTPEIEKRIKAVKTGRVPTGYCSLPGSIAPKDWKLEKLGNLFENRIDVDHSDFELLSITADKGVIPRSEIGDKDNSSEDKSKYKHICVGDIGYNTMRMWQGVSALSAYDGIVSPAYTVLAPQKDVCALYFSYLFKMQFMINLFYRSSQGLVDDTRCLKYEWFKKIETRIPPLSEQKKIAEILSVQDKIIELKEKLIIEKQKQRNCLMKELLDETAKKPFKLNDVIVDKKKWKKIKLEDFASSKTGTLPTFTAEKELYPFVNAGSDYSGYTNEYNCEGDVITTPSRGQGGIGEVFYQRGPFWLGPLSYRIKVSQGNSASYVFYIMLFNKRKIKDETKTGSIPAVNARDLGKLKYWLPPFPEQQAIAAVLSSADEEISLLQRDLEQEKLKKKSLMQLLLTGLVRV